MVRYQNKSGNSGISAYECGLDFIIVAFNDGSTYLYNYESAGGYNIELMKRKALDGRGLNRFIKQVVHHKYAAKLQG